MTDPKPLVAHPLIGWFEEGEAIAVHDHDSEKVAIFTSTEDESAEWQACQYQAQYGGRRFAVTVRTTIMAVDAPQGGIGIGETAADVTPLLAGLD